MTTSPCSRPERRRVAAGLAPLLLVVVAMGATRAAAAARDAEALATAVRTIDDSLGRWDVGSARVQAQRLAAQAPGEPAALLAAARVAFFDGDYPSALDFARRAAGRLAPEPASGGGVEGGRSGLSVQSEPPPDSGDARDRDADPDSGAAADFVRYLEARAPTWRSFTEHRSANFVLRVTPGDRILVPYALATLEASAAAIGEELGYCPSEPVVVEIYPNRRSFIAASTLTREEVETSGTVAICHFNRIMLLSPGALARGYEWLNVLCHEYTHHAVYHLGEDTVPVWLHEGIAKTLETRWRSPMPEDLDPRLSTALAEGLDQGKWVTFEQMHPSMAKLPSAGLVNLAFAEVSAAVRLLRDDVGRGAVGKLVDSLRDAGGDVDVALRRMAGVSMAEFEERTRDRAGSLNLYRVPGLRVLEEGEAATRLAFTDEGGAKPHDGEDPEADARQLEDRKARDLAILGDRLKGRQFYAAALVEYDKALDRLGHADPLLVNKKAHALILMGRPAEALPVLESVLRDSPSLTATLDNLSEVHLRLASQPAKGGDADDHARQALDFARRSEQVNPFSADTQVRLARLYERFGRRADAERARERLQALRELPGAGE